MGELSSFSDKPGDNPLAKRIEDFENDNALLALTQAGLDADAPAMEAALPAARQAYERHITSVDQWSASVGQDASLSKKVIQLADIAMLAISLYQVAKMPVVPPGGSPAPPPEIVGTLPSGAAVGSVVSLPDLARALEAIRKLVASGALDGALIAGIGKLGGGPNIALPELQRPTSLSVQSGSGTTSSPGGSSAPTGGRTATGSFEPPKASLPPNTGGKTTGVLHVPGQEPLTLTSGVKGPSQAIRGQGLPGFNGNQLTHVEGHAAAHMRTTGAREAVLDINKAPCTQGSGGGCQGLLERRTG
jgi:hypothetical protein